MKRERIVILVGPLVLLLTLPAMAAKGGKGKPPNESKEVSVIVVFRDTLGDLFASDGDSYVDGVHGIDAVLFAPGNKTLQESSIFSLGFPDAKGKNPGTTREVYLDLTDPERVAGQPHERGFLKPNHLQTIADDCNGTNLPGGILAVDVDEQACARITLFFDDPVQKNVNWRLAWSAAFGGPAPEHREVRCVSQTPSPCSAWIIRPVLPETVPVEPECNVDPDACAFLTDNKSGFFAAYSVPFEVAICLASEHDTSACPPVTLER